MTIKAWKHPIKYLRLVTTPTCDKCRKLQGRVDDHYLQLPLR